MAALGLFTLPVTHWLSGADRTCFSPSVSGAELRTTSEFWQQDLATCS